MNVRTRALLALVVGLVASSLLWPSVATAQTSASPQGRAEAALHRLYDYYQPSSGTFETTGWWNSANGITATIDYMARTGDRQFLPQVENTFEKGRTHGDGNFRNKYLDDTGWWGMAWVGAYDLTGRTDYLDMAVIDAEWMESWRTDKCGGGVVWATDSTYKNAITNELFILLNASLYNRTGDQKYLERATIVWDWFVASGMINSEGLVNDGLNGWTCSNNGQTTWTYNQGVILAASTEMWKATGQQSYLDQAVVIADAVMKSPLLVHDGILRESCEVTGSCDVNAVMFKGIFMRHLDTLDRALPDRPYRGFIQRQATSNYTKNRTSDHSYGGHWAGPVDKIDAGRQIAAIDSLVAGIAANR